MQNHKFDPTKEEKGSAFRAFLAALTLLVAFTALVFFLLLHDLRNYAAKAGSDLFNRIHFIDLTNSNIGKISSSGNTTYKVLSSLSCLKSCV